MSEKSRRTPPNVRILTKSNQVWAVDWADNPNTYCREFNTRSRELNLGLTATTYFPPQRRRFWIRTGALTSLLIVGALLVNWMAGPYWIFMSARHDVVFRYATWLHFQCNATPTHFIRFLDKQGTRVDTGRLVNAKRTRDGEIWAFNRGPDDAFIAYPVDRFRKLRSNDDAPTAYD